MAISDSEIKRIAKLSMLDIPQEKFEQLKDEMGRIIDMVNDLKGLKIEIDDENLDLSGNYNVMRSDEILPSYDRDNLLENAPSQAQGCFFVPKIVD